MSWTETQAAALGAAFASLDAEGIDWLILRNHQGLPEVNRSKDVDLGLEKADFRRAERAISRAVRTAGFSRLLVEDFQYARCLTFFSTATSDPQSIKIDLLDGFVFRGAQLFHFRQLYANARRAGQFAIPSAVDDAAMLWVKPLLTGGIVKPKYLDEIEGAARDDPAGFRAVLDGILTTDWAQRAWSRIEAGDIEGTVPLQAGLRRSAWRQAFARAPFATLRDAAHHVISEIARRIRRNPATLFSVMGPDGVGKTTFIDRFSTGLAELQVKELDTIQVQHFRPHLIPNINELLTGNPEVISEFNNPHSAAPASMPSSLLRITYYWVDYVLGYWLRLRKRIISGRTIVFDRYFYDFIVDPRRSRLSLPAWVPRLYLALTPKPDLVFFLDAEASEIYARKQELQPDEIARQLDAYRMLAEREPDRFVRLDAGQPPEKIVRDALNSLIERSFARIEL
jgi:thymidylate kinase